MGTCFKTLALEQHPLGAGVQGRPLEPFRSIAVDPRFIPIGATVYVPELVGVLMPDGTRHDGCLRADDMGGAIKEHKLDFFVESYFNFKFIADNLWWRMKATPHARRAALRLSAPATSPRDRDNEHTDWVAIHKKFKQRRMAEKVALRKTARNRAIAKAWLARHSAGPQKGHTPLARKTMNVDDLALALGVGSARGARALARAVRPATTSSTVVALGDAVARALEQAGTRALRARFEHGRLAARGWRGRCAVCVGSAGPVGGAAAHAKSARAWCATAAASSSRRPSASSAAAPSATC